jgi:putative tricarboxylic transport membrane protein
VATGMRRGWQITGLVMFVICLVTLWEAHSLSLFDRLGPGSGFFPFYLALIGAAISALIVLQVSRAPVEAEPAEPLFPRGAIAWRAFAIMALAVLATAALDWLGFRISVTLFSAALLFALGERRWWVIVLFAGVAGFGLFHLFNNWLDVLLPVGEFGI